ncbi:MAG TPA: DUF4198 domain-containing protein [Chryseolinea sp.]
MFKKILLTSILLASFFANVAQEYWMQPEKFNLKPGESVIINLMAGENFIGEPLVAETNAVQLPTSIDSIAKNENGTISYSFKMEGTELLSLQTRNIFLESDPGKFNDFLKYAGLDDIVYQREKKNAQTSPGRENLSIHTKLLLQIGESRDEDYKKVLGFPAEIIPLQNPYALKIGEKIRFKILFQGKPVFGARVKVWNRSNNRTTIQNMYTEKDGTIEAIISNDGPWMVSVVSMIPSKQEGVDWQSYRASLVFGIEK